MKITIAGHAHLLSYGERTDIDGNIYSTRGQRPTDALIDTTKLDGWGGNGSGVK